MASRYKKDYPFNFAEAAKFFILSVDKSIEDKGLEEGKTDIITLQIKTVNYPYDKDIMSLIKNTFDIRGIKVILSSYSINKDIKVTDKKTHKYEFKFKIEKK